MNIFDSSTPNGWSEFSGDTNKLQAKRFEKLLCPTSKLYLILLTLKSIEKEHDKSKYTC